MIRKIGTTTYRRYIGKQYAFEIDVQQVDGQVAAHFVSSLQVDVDGAPKAYHEGDEEEYDNNWPCFDWLKNLNPNDRHGKQGIGGAHGPAYGYTISATSLKDETKPENDTDRYVDASTIPYFVAPTEFPLPAGTKNAASLKDCIGCLAYVVDLITGHSSGAVYADEGYHVGEGSLALALRLGRTPFYSNCYPKVSGMDDKRFFTVVFPNERRTKSALSLDVIQTKARALFDAWGGWAQLATVLKAVPRETPHFADDDNVASIHLPADKGPADAHMHIMTADIAPPAQSMSTARPVDLLPAPGAGAALSALPAGVELTYVQATPDKQWYRVIAKTAPKKVEGYIRAADVSEQSR